MSIPAAGVAVAGVDGCRKGWIAVIREPAREPFAAVFNDFAALVDALPSNAIVVVDMPIGLPDKGSRRGRGAEEAVRGVLKLRRTSVFSIPSRGAVYHAPGPFDNYAQRKAARKRASDYARQTSDPPGGVSFQAFSIFTKICQVDTLLLNRPELLRRIFESHPEVAFWRLNGEREMNAGKKSAAGIEERRTVLAGHGFERSFLDRKPPPGAAIDDFLDAAAMMLVAARKAVGMARPFPDPPLEDGRGIPVAIWA